VPARETRDRPPDKIPRVSEDLPLNNSSTPAWIGRAIWVGVGLAIGLTLLNAFRPGSRDMTTNTRSASLPTEQAKIEFLNRYLVLPTDVQGTEFHIVFHDNRKGLVPGPSDFDIQVAVKVPPDKVSAWTAEMPKAAAPFDVSWAQDVLPRDDRWATHSTPHYYERAGVYVVTYEPEGIVLKRVTKH
jgi:hypothetical protein